MVSSSVLTPMVGKLGAAHGKKRLLVVMLALFGAASVGAASAWSIGSLVAFRALQGVGAAIFPLPFGIIRDEFPAEKVGVAIGTMSSVFGTWWRRRARTERRHRRARRPALAVSSRRPAGPGGGGARCPAGPGAPEADAGAARHAGAAALSAGFAAFLLALSQGDVWGWASPGVLGLLAGAALMLWAWVAIERRVAEPLVERPQPRLASRPISTAPSRGA